MVLVWWFGLSLHSPTVNLQLRTQNRLFVEQILVILYCHQTHVVGPVVLLND